MVVIGSAEWLEFDPGFDHGTCEKRSPNVKDTFGDSDAEYEGADVRQSNITGQIGDKQFNEVVSKLQSPMTLQHLSWRSVVAGLAFAPLAALKPLGKIVGDSSKHWLVRAGATVGMMLCPLPLRMLSKKLLLVKSGELTFVQLAEDGTTRMLQSGIHLLPNIGSQTQTFAVNDDQMEFGTMKLIRVRPAYIGIATDNGKPVMLLTGIHVFNAPNFQYQGPVSVNENTIQNGPLNVIRVQPGLVGLAQINGLPLVLEQGIHFINEPTLVMSGFQKVDEPVIQVGPLRIIVVPRGKVAAVLVNGEGHFLPEGRHFINQGRFQLIQIQNLSTEYINAGIRHRVMVPYGKLGLGLQKGEPLLLEPGSVHLKNDALFEYKGSVDITSQKIVHGSWTIVIVKDGQVGITYHNGILELFQPGRHMLKEATHILGGIISTGQQTLRISEVTGMSSDNVQLCFDAAICMRIVDAQKAVTMLTQGKTDLMKEVQANIQERAKLALSIIIGNNSLNKKHGATVAVDVDAESKDDDDKNGFVDVDATPRSKSSEGNSFRQQIHDVFMHGFRTSMNQECGIQVIDMSIEDVRIINEELATAMASAAVANSSLERANIEAEIVQVKASADSKVALIDARGKASAMEIMAKAEADRIATISSSLAKACGPAQQLELVRASGNCVNKGSTVMLAQDTGALATLLSGAQGAALGPKIR